MFDSTEQQLEDLDAVNMVGGLHLVNTKESVKNSGQQKKSTSTKSEKEADTEWDEKNKWSWVKDQENTINTCWDDSFCSGNRPGFHEFNEFLQGTQGAKLLSLWMDIERLKAVQHTERKNR